MAAFNVGDSVVFVDYRGVPETTTITRVGRKYAYIEQYGRERGFNIETGHQADHKYGYADAIYTEEQWAQRTRRAEVISGLSRHNIAPRSGGWTQPLPVLEKMLELLDTEQENTDD